MPDPVWAPAWVCWRNTGQYAGWAPLPPGVAFRPGTGTLTFHGRPVVPGFHFGLGADAFAFVNVAHFLDHHLTASVVPHSQNGSLFGKTVVTAGITSGVGGLSNRGLDAAVVAATSLGTVHQIALRDVGAPVSGGIRAESLSLGGKSLSVFRPQLPADGSRLVAIPRKSEVRVAELETATPQPPGTWQARTVAQAAAAGPLAGGNPAASAVPPDVRFDAVQEQPVAGDVAPRPAALQPDPLAHRAVGQPLPVYARPAQTPDYPGWNRPRQDAPIARVQHQATALPMEPVRFAPVFESRGGPATPAPSAEPPRVRIEEPHSAPAAVAPRAPEPAPAAPRPPEPAPQPSASGGKSGR